MVLATGACAPAFMVGKAGSDEKGVFLGSKSKAAYNMLCVSGDLAKVLATSHLSKEMKDDLYKYNCSEEERSTKKLRKLYGSMTRAERKDIKLAFKKNGFAINGGEC
jgi:hypothetical protein